MRLSSFPAPFRLDVIRNDMENPRPISIAALATGLVSDFKRLCIQEMLLAQHETQLELRKLVLVFAYAVLGILLSFLAVTFFLVMLVYAVHSFASMPLWASYGIVGLMAASLGGIVGYGLHQAVSRLRLWPFRTVHSIKEDAQWIKQQLLSTRT